MKRMYRSRATREEEENYETVSPGGKHFLVNFHQCRKLTVTRIRRADVCYSEVTAVCG